MANLPDAGATQVIDDLAFQKAVTEADEKSRAGIAGIAYAEGYIYSDVSDWLEGKNLPDAATRSKILARIGELSSYDD
jgi:hypothetical protein